MKRDMKDENIDLDDIIKQANEQIRETPSDLPSRYKLIEDTFFNQVRSMQDRLNDMVNDGSATVLRSMSGACKDMMNNYNETCRLRKLAEIECGRVVPMRVLEQYQRDILPAVASGIDNLRMEVTNKLQPQERASFQAAWNAAYPKFVDILKDAAGKLEKYIDEAKLEATGNIPKKTQKQKNSAVEKSKMSQRASQRHTRERNLK